MDDLRGSSLGLGLFDNIEPLVGSNTSDRVSSALTRVDKHTNPAWLKMWTRLGSQRQTRLGSEFLPSLLNEGGTQQIPQRWKPDFVYKVALQRFHEETR